MAVNESVYGAKDTWIRAHKLNISTDKPYVKDVDMVYVCNFNGGTTITNASTLEVGAETKKVQYNNHIDNSFAFFGVDKKASIVDQIWVARDSTPDNLTSYVKLKVNDVNPVGYCCNTGSMQNTSYRNRSRAIKCDSEQSVQRNAWGTTHKVTNINADNTFVPATKIPTTLTYLIVIYAYTRDFDEHTYKNYTGYKCDLYTYCNASIDGVKICDLYPYVAGVWLAPLLKKNIDITTNDHIRNVTPLGSFAPVILNECLPFDSPYIGTDTLLRYTQPTIGIELIATINIYDTDTQTIKTASLPGNRALVIHGGNSLFNDYPEQFYYGIVGADLVTHAVIYDGTKKAYYFAQWTNYNTFGTIQDFWKYCMTQTAYLGAFFTDSYYAVIDEPYDSDKIYLGLIDDNGVTHGQYVHGQENTKQKQWTWESLEESPFDPNVKPDAPDKELESDKYNYYEGNAYRLTTGNYYAMTVSEIAQLHAWSNSIVRPSGKFVPPGTTPGDNEYTYEDLGYNLQFMFAGAYPEEQIISLMCYPFDITSVLSFISPNQEITLGYASTKAYDNWFGSNIPAVTTSKLISGNGIVVFNSGDYPIEELFGDFRDYPPYTSIDLMIPWHGTISLDVGYWYGHSINTRMIIDIITGASTTVIERDGIPVGTIDGQVGLPYQLIARNVGEYTSTLIQGSQSANHAKIAMIGNYVNNVGTTLDVLTPPAVSGSVNGMAMSAVNAIPGKISGALMGTANNILNMESTKIDYKNAQYKVAHNKASTSIVSAHSPAVSQFFEPYPRIIRHYPRMMSGYNPNVYGRTVGFACELQGNVGSFTGYSVFSGVDLTGIGATESEKQMIYSQLLEGIII